MLQHGNTLPKNLDRRENYPNKLVLEVGNIIIVHCGVLISQPYTLGGLQIQT
jgi:hypothetical protein